jgi:hypothetical protein
MIKKKNKNLGLLLTIGIAIGIVISLLFIHPNNNLKSPFIMPDEDSGSNEGGTTPPPPSPCGFSGGDYTFTCVDNDGGINVNVSSSVTITRCTKGKGSNCTQITCLDQCTDSNTLNEMYCATSKSYNSSVSKQTCTNGCINGVCQSGTGILLISSYPDAFYNKYFDGIFVGTGNVVLNNVVVGNHTVLENYTGYYNLEQQVNVKSGSNDITLSPTRADPTPNETLSGAINVVVQGFQSGDTPKIFLDNVFNTSTIVYWGVPTGIGYIYNVAPGMHTIGVSNSVMVTPTNPINVNVKKNTLAVTNSTIQR